MKALYLGCNWPQPSITAAGVRTVGIMRALEGLGYRVKFVSAKKPNEFQLKTLMGLGVEFEYCENNSYGEFEKVFNDPEICIFDTFKAEEMFGHMVY